VKFFINSISSFSLIVLILLVYLDLSDHYLISIVLGWGLAILYIITGYVLFYKAITLKKKSFGKFITVSVFGRLILMVLGITICVKFLDINNTVFIITLFSFYFIFQIIEVIGLNRISIKGA